MKLKALVIVLIGFFLSLSTSVAGDNVSVPPTKPSFLTRPVDATLGKPEAIPAGGAPAVVILHHGGGCLGSQTPQYAKALNAAGYVTLEPCLFSSAQSRSSSTVTYLPQVFGALRFLAQLPFVDKTRIGITGGSYGGVLSLVSATDWAYRTHADPDFPKFAAHAPFYPPCFLVEQFVRAKKGRSDIPGDAYDRFGAAPIRIYAGGKDDYEDRDPKSCESLLEALPLEVRPLITIKLFPEASHGWDHGSTYSFFERVACKGRGCTNTNTSDPVVTLEGIKDLIDFLSRSMPAR